ncbi:hypothetical protein PC129_g10825 [Phytophthora cactorum]|uniref:Uncharacterized protein n=1 Tax=Phytophthora cactorum TaxID=29920 RepID=A0A329SJZ7_9STRA|nr:hypothetical protein Pcac1_g12252 [Phytophthora cactorum]KAG2815918.1 hypothetical protein PC112_g13677 [Phytophthora cactorum]KAG2821135.1 hypothetical protein PC111_g11169 [Phytophthora cactorum]KAG2853617.1 hypothetical protein PC113_g14026 [Phytophthora cactorum]KAG2896967.1 hypothetical protein PC114_g14863 [Phytophthora cactorum]
MTNSAPRTLDCRNFGSEEHLGPADWHHSKVQRCSSRPETQAQNALDSNHSASGTSLAEDTESASGTSVASTAFADTAALVAAEPAAGMAPDADTTLVAASEQVVGETLDADTTPVDHTAPAVEPVPTLSIAPAVRSAEAERTVLAGELELAAGHALVAQAAPAAGSRQMAHTALTTELLPAPELAPTVRTVASAEVGLTVGSSSLVSTALGFAALVALTLPCPNFESDPAPNHLVEVGSADTADHLSARPKLGALPALANHLAAEHLLTGHSSELSLLAAMTN